MDRTRIRRIVVGLSVALVATGCSGGDGGEAGETTTSGVATSAPVTESTASGRGDQDDPPPSSTTEAPATTSEPSADLPRFEPDGSVCADIEEFLGSEIECGYVVVPADHDDVGAGEHRLATLRLPSRSDDPGPPVVYLSGGPGGHAIDPLPFAFDVPFDRMLEDRDVIIFDQRGMGRSEPNLRCPGFYDALDEVGADPAATSDDVDAVLLAELATCVDDRRADGIDFAHFGTDTSADDVDMVRRALGIDRWHLFGISYGTRLGLEVMRRHPEPVLSAVLDSVFPLDVNGQLQILDGFDDSLDGVEALCGAEPACAAGPDLTDRLASLADELDAEPLELELVNPLTADEVDVVVDGDLLVDVVANALYDPLAFTDLPELFSDLESGGLTAMTTFGTLALLNREFATTLAHAAVMCRDDVSRSDAAAVAAAEPDDEIWRRSYDSISSGLLSIEVCAILDAGGPGEGAGEAVSSDIPTLLLAGQLDPVTPPSYARQAAATLPRSSIVDVPSYGHAVSTNECLADVLALFLADGRVDDRCVAVLPSVEFFPEPGGDVTLVPVTAFIADTGAEVDTVLPDDWTAGPSGFDFARGRSVLDEAALTILAGPAMIEGVFVGVFEQALGAELTRSGDVEIGERVWSRRTGLASGSSIEIYTAPDGDDVVLVAFVSSPEERDLLFTSVVSPALDAIAVR